jgi:nitrite reductase/ring-hydroxylating ferredoxin subunit
VDVTVPGFVEVAKLADLPPGGSTTVAVAGRVLAMFNVDGTVYATNDACLHAGGSLGSFSQLEGKVVTCRLHGRKYDVTNGNMPDAPDMSLRCYPVKIVDGTIQVAVL